MSVLTFIERIFDRFLPSPFTIAVLLSLLSMVLAMVFTDSDIPSLLSNWQNGMWDTNLIVFAYQMMLILILGHMLVLSPPIKRLIELSLVHLKNPTRALIFTAASTMLLAFFNWGLSLIYGALLARKIGEQAAKQKIAINYPLLGAAGYSGLMLWHGGLSGSAPLKAAESGHLSSMVTNLPELQLPEVLKTSQTVLSTENLIIFFACFVLVLGSFWVLSKRTAREIPIDLVEESPKQLLDQLHPLETKRFLPIVFGVLLLLAFWFSYPAEIANGIISPNMLNFLMLGLAVLLHKNIIGLLHALDKAISGAAGILIQFPLYFGIMGIVRHSGLLERFTENIIAVSSTQSMPLLTFFSAALVNIFVPSGGGQWAIQAPTIIESALRLGIPLEKMLMAFAYGDQLTNMLQPFWALPLLAITGIKAKALLPYTLIVMLVGLVVFITGIIWVL